MCEFDAAVGETPDGRRVRHHQNRVAFRVKFAQKAEHNFLVGLVEVAGRLIRQNQIGMIDQRAGHGHALLFAAGELRGQVLDAVTEAHAFQRLLRLFSSVVL